MNNLKEEFSQMYKIYSEEISDKIITLEPEREKRLKKLVHNEILLFLLIIIVEYFSYIGFLWVKHISYIPQEEFFATSICIAFVVILPYIGVCIIPYYMYRCYKNSVLNFKKFLKSQFMGQLLKSIKSLKWDFGEPETKLPLYESEMFAAFNTVNYDDRFSVIYEDTEVQINEVNIKRESNNDDSSLFKGIIISTILDKKIEGKIIITSKNDILILGRLWNPIYSMIFTIICLIFFIYGFFNLMTNEDAALFIIPFICTLNLMLVFGFYTIIQMNRENKYEKKSYNNDKFAKKFDVLAKNQAETDTIITQEFMDKLANFQGVFNAKDIKCSFFDDKVMFAISTKDDLFEIGNLFVPLTDKKQIEKFYKELTSIYNMIDYFKLTQKTGL